MLEEHLMPRSRVPASETAEKAFGALMAELEDIEKTVPPKDYRYKVAFSEIGDLSKRLNLFCDRNKSAIDALTGEEKKQAETKIHEIALNINSFTEGQW